MTLKKLIGRIIDNGANVNADAAKVNDWVNFTLRIRRDILTDIDKVLEKKVGLTKTAWILQAIQNELKNTSEAD